MQCDPSYNFKFIGNLRYTKLRIAQHQLKTAAIVKIDWVSAKLLKSFTFSRKWMKNLDRLRYFPTFVLVLVSVLLVSGCDGFAPRTVAQMCEENPDICNDLNPDYWCRAEKADIIKHRYEYLEEMPDKAQYDLLIMFEDYKVCIDKAAQILQGVAKKIPNFVSILRLPF